MPVLLLALLLGTFAFLYWRSKTTTLTRNCRWRQDRAAGDWACSFCGARIQSEASPTSCENPDR